MSHLMKSKYWTLNELMDEGLFDDFTTDYPLSSLAVKGFESTWATTIQGFIQILAGRYGESYILRKDYDFFEAEPVVELSDIDRLSRRFQNILNLTASRYLSLLNAYNKYISDPTAPISASSDGTTRFNDTPQDGGDYSDDEHSTNITQSHTESTADTSSIMDRLDGLYRNWRNVLKDWCDEFLGMLKEIWED